MITKEELAKRLDGREYMEEITDSEVKIAEDNGLVVVFGASDDLVEFRGAIRDEVNAYDGREIFLTPTRILENHDDCECPYCGYEELRKHARMVRALWDADKKHSWIYETEIPHATFEIVEDGEPFCRGIVFEFKELEKK